MSTVTVLRPAAPAMGPTPNDSATQCGQCGADVSFDIASRIAADAQRRIAELEAQVKILTGKATAAVDKLADYEDQLHQLKSQTSAGTDDHQQRPSSANPAISSPGTLSATQFPTPTGTPPPPSAATMSTSPAKPNTNSATAAPNPPRGLQSRITNLLPTSSLRRTTSQPFKSPPESSSSNPSVSISTPTQSSFNKSPTPGNNGGLGGAAADEIEELSAALFTEANEMVAAERKARKKLEERVQVLERRDREKRERLAVLEGRLGRIERVRGLLSNPAPAPAAAAT